VRAGSVSVRSPTAWGLGLGSALGLGCRWDWGWVLGLEWAARNRWAPTTAWQRVAGTRSLSDRGLPWSPPWDAD